MNNQDTRFANQYAIQWFPGHMAKTLRMMEQEIQHVDASLVLLDARIPLSSLNPEIERITARKPKLYALNKADLADPAVTEEWIRYFHEADAGCVAISAIKDDILDVEELAMNLLDEVRRNYPDLVAQRYKLDAETLALPPYELMEAIGRKRGLLVRGGEVNTERCAVMLVDEFRACKWGRISLERPPQRDDMADFAEEDEE